MHLLALIFISFSVNAIDANSIFYPLSSQTQGQFLTAKKLFMNENGGFWIQDVRNNIYFYDGQHVLKKSENKFGISTENLTYAEGDFWFSQGNKLFRMSPSGKREVILNLVNTESFKNVGYSNRHIWTFSSHYFHSYDLETSRVSSIPTSQITQGSINEDTQIKSAIFVHGQWVVATKSAIFSFSPNGVKRLAFNQHSTVYQLYYDQGRERILVATDRGLDIMNAADWRLLDRLKSEGVVSVAITATDYWIGTKNGLLIYNLKQKYVSKISANYQDDYSLASNQIFDIALDTHDGVWIATARGVSYYSLRSHRFKRARFGSAMNQVPVGKINDMLLNNEGDSWLATTTGLYRVHFSENSQYNTPQVEKIMDGDIRNIVSLKGEYWISSKNQLWRIDPVTYQSRPVSLTPGLLDNPITHLSVDASQTLWISTNTGLYRYSPISHYVNRFGLSWMQEDTYDSVITDLYSDQQGRVWIGTDHGLYEYLNGQILFDVFSADFGGTNSISQFSDKTLWAVNNYGVIAIDIAKSHVVRVPLKYGNSAALCVASSIDGTWLTSTKGISFYNSEGLLQAHFPSPFGIVSNEFLLDGCTLSPNGKQLLLSSKLGIVKVSTQQLLNMHPPENDILIGEVLLDRSRVMIAPNPKQELHLDYGKSLTFLFGVLPDFDVPNLQYRLLGGEKQNWELLQGSQLTFNHLNPGRYTLEFQTLSQVGSSKKNTQYRFVIDEPWYLSGWFTLLFVIGILLLLASIFVWRARAMVSSNMRLRRLINLKTTQLKHQSQLLISSNALLRRQAKTRELLTKEVSREACKSIKDIQNNLHSYSTDSQLQILQQSLNYLEQINLIHSSSEEPALPQGKMVSLVIKAIVQVWQADANKAGVRLEVQDRTPDCMVRVHYANFDTVLNSLIASALIRSYQHQKVILTATLLDNNLQIIVQDTGSGIAESEILAYEAQEFGLDISPITKKSMNTTLSSIAELVHQSGGTFTFDANKLSHITSMVVTWPVESDELSAGNNNDWLTSELQHDKNKKLTAGKHSQCNGFEHSINFKDAWLEKVYSLVSVHYPNPEFSTSLAAKLLFVSERSLQRKFKDLAERSFMEYLTQYRLEKACEMLMSGQKISDTAFESGFNDPSYFSQRFKNHFGLTPSQFVERTLQE